MPKTNIKPKQLFEQRNTSNILQRQVILGILSLLNRNLKYKQVWEDSEDGIQEVTVPFFFNFGGGSGSSERFIQDNYMHWTDDECTSMGMRKLDGDYKPLPYGVLSLDSVSIEAGNIANRFVMGQYQKKHGNEFKSYVAFLYSIPLTMNFSVNIGCDTINTMWKIEQAYREYFYKNRTFRVNYNGTVVACRIGFPESMTIANNAQYVFGQQTTDGTPDIKLTFNLSCETYQPVFDPNTEMLAEHSIQDFRNGISFYDSIGTDSQPNTHDGKIVPLTDLSGKVFTTLQDTIIEWKYYSEHSDLLKVDILLQKEDDDTMTLVETVDNHNFYNLALKEDMVDDALDIDLILPSNDDCMIINQPVIKFYCDIETNIVDASKCVVIDKGFIMTNNDQVDAIISYEDSKGMIKDKPVKLNILNNALDENDPIEMDEFIYSKEYTFTRLKLFIRDHDHPEDIAPLQGEDGWISVF